MAWKEHCVCDGCGQSKNATNHWFVVVMRPRVNMRNDDAWKRGLFAVLRWTNAAARRAGAKHYCGSGCLTKVVSQIIGGRHEKQMKKGDANGVA